ncbi:MAG: thioredoxin domain-containing protein [Acidobacteriota bacterium]|nr:thioredoxin domain-containing protein [Acidobacteriota bacterium]
MKSLVLGLSLATLALCALPDPPKSKIAGLTTAPIRLELYEDFSCPHCRVVHEQMLPQLIRDFVAPGKAYIVFRDYVLNGPGHQYSRMAATYAAAAARIGKYQAACDAIFQSQNSWAFSGQIWPNISASFNAEEQKKILALAQEPSLQTEVQNDVDAGNALPITQTPTMIVVFRGRRQPWTVFTSYDLLKSYLDQLLKGR